MARTPRPESVIYPLLEHAVPVIRQELAANTCIFHSRVAFDVLRHFGLPARAVPVVVTALNPAATAYVAAGGKGDHGWRITGGGVGEFGHDPGTNRYNGHLVVASSGYVLDLTLDQFSRPELDLPLAPIVFQSQTIRRGEDDIVGLGDITVVYQPRKDTTYAAPGSAWGRTPQHRRLTAEVIRRIETARRKTAA